MSTSTQQNQNGGMTFAELEAYTKQQEAADQAERKQTGKNFVRYGGGYSSTPVDNTSVKLAQPMYDDLAYYTQGEKRYIKEGTSGADETFMTREDYALVQNYKQQWADANARGDTAAAQLAHEAAEAIRAKYGYSGDTETRGDGGGYTYLGKDQENTGYGLLGNGGANAAPQSAPSQSDQLRSLLDQWKQAAIDQNNGQIDYAVAKAVADLERALEDAQPQYKEQAEAVAKDEMQALDNSALYAEARGDKGGIGQSQYNEIQAAAAQNRLTVQQAQTKLSTDTARQIADLRAQGEFEKADKVLSITQQYLSQLISLEQWAAEFGLSQQQFQASLDQWQAEYDLAMKEFDFKVSNTQNSQYADMGSALLSAGIMPNTEQLAAMGMTEAQAQQYMMQYQLEQAAGGSGGGNGGTQAQSNTPTVDDKTNTVAAETGGVYGKIDDEIAPLIAEISPTHKVSNSGIYLTNRSGGTSFFSWAALQEAVRTGLVLEEADSVTGELVYRMTP